MLDQGFATGDDEALFAGICDPRGECFDREGRDLRRVVVAREIPAVRRVAPAAAQVAGREAEEQTRTADTRSFTLNRLGDFRNFEAAILTRHVPGFSCYERDTMSYSKRDGRPLDQIRPTKIVTGFHEFAEGSVLLSTGRTRVLVTASVDESVPDFLVGKGQGWLTAEYQMHPRANPKRREKRDGRERPLGGRSREIERLIGARCVRPSIWARWANAAS